MKAHRVLSAVLIFGCLAIGIVLLAVGIRGSVLQHRQTAGYQTADGAFADYTVYSSDRDGTTYQLIYLYTVEGETYSVATDYGTGSIPEIGSTKTILYNPDNPEEAVLAGVNRHMLTLVLGGKLMMPPILILVLAWTLKGMTDALGIGDFVRQAVSLNEGLMRFVPLLIFCIAIFIAFSSGTSWGTFAILVPIVVNMFSETDPTMMIVAVSAVLAGAVCGDHISPISDTTIMSSSGAQSNHINHVQTQMQYAMVVVAACVPGYLIAGFTENWLITLVSSLAILTVALLYLRRRSLAEDARA